MKIKTLFICASSVAVLAACNREPFTPVSVVNPWQDNYTKFVTDSIVWDSCGTYNIQDPVCLYDDGEYYIFSSDVMYINMQQKESKSDMPDRGWQGNRPGGPGMMPMGGGAMGGGARRAGNFGGNRQNRNNATNTKSPSGTPTNKIPSDSNRRMGAMPRGNGQMPPMMGRGSEKIGNGYIQIRKSKDLVNWEFIGWAFDSIPQEITQWANENGMGFGTPSLSTPTITKEGKQYKLEYRISMPGAAPCKGYAEASSIEGPWTHKGIIENENLYENRQIIYNAENKKYYKIVSNSSRNAINSIIVGRSDSQNGPFTDYKGGDIDLNAQQATTLFAPYKFDNHSGWYANGTFNLFQNKKNEWFICHQGKLAPDNMFMDLHVRRIIFTADGWPVISPERYTACDNEKFTMEDLCGDYEIIRFNPSENSSLSQDEHNFQAGRRSIQELQTSKFMNIEVEDGDWSFNEQKQLLNLTLWDGETADNLTVFKGHDWENQTETILFIGVDSKGRTLWGKRLDS